MNKGYVKLWRKSVYSDVFCLGEKHWYVWSYLLLKSTHRPHEQIIGSGKLKKTILLNNGQCFCGTLTLAKTLKIKRTTLIRILDKLIEINVINRQIICADRIIGGLGKRTRSDIPLGSVVTICNWGKYQHLENDDEKDTVDRVSGHKQKHTSNTITPVLDEGWWICRNEKCNHVNSKDESICICGEYL